MKNLKIDKINSKTSNLLFLLNFINEFYIFLDLSYVNIFVISSYILFSLLYAMISIVHFPKDY